MSYSQPLVARSDSWLNSRPASPTKQHTSQQLLPLKSVRADRRSVSKIPGPGFHIYHDPPSSKSPTLSGAAQDVLNDDKENILQPKVMGLLQHNYTHRRPLAPLSIQKFPGYASSVGQLRRGRQRLTTIYQPKNFQNESRSVHKFSTLPSFVTPPRNSLTRILHRSGSNAGDDEVDDLEQMLIAKLKEVARRKRAMSVGANRGKQHLIRKVNFTINAMQ